MDRIDEVRLWDRAIAASEVTGYYNATNAGSSIVGWLDMETRANSNDLFDFGGAGHLGLVTGTTVLEGRAGFARSFKGTSDGIVLSGTTSTSFTGGAAASVYVLVSSYPAVDMPVLARKGYFYLNVTSDGRVSWSVYTKSTILSLLPLSLNRWVRIAVTAGSSGSSILIDGVQVSSTATASAPLAASTGVTLGYAEGVTSRFVGSLDEVLVLNAVPSSSSTMSDLGIRGIQLNPNGTDTDGDGLADGQELFAKTVKTPLRYPTKDQLWVSTDKIDLGLGVPAWAIQGVQAMVGFTHGDMGQVAAWLERSTGTSDDLGVQLRQYGNAGQFSNFTSYDLFQKPSLAGNQLARDDLVTAGRTWYVKAYDSTAGKGGQIEYLQIQVTVHTLPNRADTDGDTLNDSEELNLGSDGFQTNPWKADTDGDTLADNEYFTKGTSPVLADTDRDGVRDDRDLAPLGDAFVEIRIDSTYVAGSDGHNANNMPLPFVAATIQGNTTYTASLDSRSGTWYTIDYVSLNTYLGHKFSVNVPDDTATVAFTIQMWSRDSRGYNQHTSIAVSSHTSGGTCVNDYTASLTYTLQAAGQSTTYQLRGCNPPNNAPMYAAPLNVTLTTFVPNRIPSSTIVPADYSGVYNVTNANGVITGQRYVGEPRFVALLLNEATWMGSGFNCWCGPPIQVVVLVPRSWFFASRLYAFLNGTNPPSPLDKLVFRQNDTSATSNSDSLQEILATAAGVTFTQADGWAVLDYLTRNASGATVGVVIGLTNDLYLYSLPDGAVQVVGYSPPLTAPSPTYTFCTSSCGPPTPKPWWEQVWEGLVSIVIAVVTSAVVLAVNAFAQLVQVLSQVGAWLWNNVVGPGIAVVASAVRAAAKVLEQLGNAILQFIENQIESQIQSMLSLLKFLLGGQSDSVKMYALSNQQTLKEGNADSMSGLLNVVYSGTAFNLAVGFLVLVEGIWITVKAASFGIAEVAAEALDDVAKYITGALIGLALGMGFVGSMMLFDDFLHSLIPSTDRFWSEGAGLAVASAVLAATRFVAEFAAKAFVSGSKVFWVAIAIFSMALQFAAAFFGPRNFVGEVIAVISWIVDLVALEEIVVKPDHLIDLIASPFSLLDTGIAVVTLGYDTAGLLKETGVA